MNPINTSTLDHIAKLASSYADLAESHKAAISRLETAGHPNHRMVDEYKRARRKAIELSAALRLLPDMLRVCDELAETVEATGGIVYPEAGLPYPNADPTWVDLVDPSAKAIATMSKIREMLT